MNNTIIAQYLSSAVLQQHIGLVCSTHLSHSAPPIYAKSTLLLLFVLLSFILVVLLSLHPFECGSLILVQVVGEVLKVPIHYWKKYSINVKGLHSKFNLAKVQKYYWYNLDSCFLGHPSHEV